MKIKPTICMLFGGIALCPAAFLIDMAGVPRIWSPMPVPLLLLMFICYPAAIVAPSLVFWLIGVPLFAGKMRIPTFSIGFFALLALLNGVSIVGGWEYGLKYQGLPHTIAVSLINVYCCGALAFVAYEARRNSHYVLNYAFH